MRVRDVQRPDGRPAFEVRRWLTSVRRIRSIVTAIPGESVRFHPLDRQADSEVCSFSVSGAQFRLELVRGHLERFVVTQEQTGCPEAFGIVRDAFSRAWRSSIAGL